MTQTRTGYTGQEQDRALGLVNMRGRMYDPELGRFLSADPIMGSPLDSQSWNPYSYVRNSPLNGIDPSGFIEASQVAQEEQAQEAQLAARTSEEESQAASARVIRDNINLTEAENGLRLSSAAVFVAETFEAGRKLVGAVQSEAAEWAPAAVAAAEIVGGFAPGLGEFMDVRLVLDSKAPTWQRAVAGASLVANALTAGVLPNAGGVIRGGEELAEVGVRTAAREVATVANGGGGMVDDAVRASTPVGRRGGPLTVQRGTNVPETIGGRDFTGHALDQMQGRGLTPTVAENVIQNGERAAGNRPDTFEYVLDGVKLRYPLTMCRTTRASARVL